MTSRLCLLAFLGLFAVVGVVGAQGAGELPGDRNPLLQLRASGPTAAVTALTFGKAGKGAGLILYAGGYDKVVHTWLGGVGGAFTPAKTYRLPIGPGAQGAINALAVSPDGGRMAAAGKGVVREEAGFFNAGIVVPRDGRFTDSMLQDEGTIFLFDTIGEGAWALRGHRGPVLALAFAPPHKDKPPVLVSIGREAIPGRQGWAGVMRLWDGKTGKPLARSARLPDPADGRPGLAVWHTGDDVREVCVVVGCHGQPLRLWNASAEAVQDIGDSLYYNESAAYLGGGSLLTCGTSSKGSARLLGWKAAGASRLDADDDANAALPPFSVTYALAPLAGRPGGKIDHLALVQRFLQRTPNKAEPEDYRLLIVGLGRAGGPAFGAEQAEIPLWRGGPRPALATSPDGQYLAVGGHQVQGVQIYSAAELLAGKARPQVLGSEGTTFGRARFVRKGAARGLLLDEPGASPTPLVLDLSSRALSDRAEGWEVDAPNLDRGGWSVERPAGARPGEPQRFVVSRRGELAGETSLQSDQQATAWAILPPGPRPSVPLLAIAYIEKGVHYLGLWDAATGRQVRQLTGHQDRVTALSFDGAGRHLVSAGEDQTIRVWSLNDLGQTLGRRGTLQGLALKGGEGGLRIALLDSGRLSQPNREALREVHEDDSVEGLVVDGKLRKFTTPQTFYEAIWELRPACAWANPPRPADHAVLRIGRQDVSLRVDQGTDEAKPLFSVFVSAGGKLQDRTWVGWSPEGPYDTANLEKGERLIGWHSNTGKASAPTAFAEAGKYHNEFYRDRILQHLLERGNLPGALEEWKKAAGLRPRVELWLEGLDPFAPRDAGGRPLVREGTLTLQAEVTEVHPAKVQKVEWEVLRDGPRGPQTIVEPKVLASDGSMRADLPLRRWGRGVYTVRLLVTLRQDPPVTLTTSKVLHYLPPRPTVAFPADWVQKTFSRKEVPERFDVRARAFRLEAHAEPARGNSAVPARLRVRLNGKTVDTSGADFRKDLQLEQGRNDVEVEAVNAGALEDPTQEHLEAAVRRLVLYYTPERLPPNIAVLSVTPAGAAAVEYRPGKVVGVTAARVRVRGQVSADEDLSDVVYRVDGGTPITPRGFTKGRAFLFDEEIDLKKLGETTLDFRASAGGRKAEPQTVVLDFSPLLPDSLRLESKVIEPNAPHEVALAGLLAGPDDVYPYQVREVRVNRVKVGFEFYAKGQRLTWRAPVEPGDNRVEVVLSNGRREGVVTAAVYRKRPPKVVSFEPLGKPSGPSASFRVVVETAVDCPPTAARFGRTRAGGMEVDSQEIDWRDLASSWKRVEKEGRVEWGAVIEQAPLAENANAFRVEVVNRDGVAQASAEVLGPKPPAKPPEVFLSDLPRTAIHEPSCQLTIKVHSDGPPAVRVYRKGREVQDPALAAPDREGDNYIYRLRKLSLEEGTNELEVVATNAGEPGKARANISYVPPIAEVSLDEYTLPGGSGAAPLGDRPLPARITLLGKVRWPNPDDPALTKRLKVRVWVNDVEQAEIALGRPQDGVRKFELPVCFNLQENRVQLGFSPEVKLREGMPRTYTVRCDRPELAQRLHLVIAAPGLKAAQREALKAQVLAALGAQPGPTNSFRTPAFPEGGVVHPVVGGSDPLRLESLLYSVKVLIHDSPGARQDVVLVYFRGRMWLNGRKPLLLWNEPAMGAEPASFASDPDRLRGILEGLQGAKLLLLDVDGPRDSPAPIAGAFPRVGYLHYLWLGAANAAQRPSLIAELGRSLERVEAWGPARRSLLEASTKQDKVTVRSSPEPVGYDAILLRRKQEP
jgi:WD40 repeat protein